MKYLKYLLVIVIALFFLVACEKAPVDPYGGDYKRKTVSSEGLQFVVAEETEGEETYRVFDEKGNQIGLDYDLIEFLCDDELTDVSFSEAAPTAPYKAGVYGENGLEYWLLGADGKAINSEFYDDIFFASDSEFPILATQNGNLYYLSNTGEVVGTDEASVTHTFFDGEYQLYQYYRYAIDSPLVGLLDRYGNEIVSPEYSRIEMPFKDRYILYEGSFQSMSSMKAMLYNTEGEILSEGQNDIKFYETECGACFGLAYAGDYYNPEFCDQPVYDSNGDQIPYGMWFTDKDGTPITGSYKSVAFFPEGTEIDESVYTAEGWAPTEYFFGSVDSVNENDFFLVLNFDGELETLTVDILCTLAESSPVGEEEVFENPATGKPVIYLYPEKETEVSVKLDFNGKLTYTYPALNDGWKVTAKPDGSIINKADGSLYRYLFWEGVADYPWAIDKGFVVAGKDTEAFLVDALTKMGLKSYEIADFVTYWAPRMIENKYNLISFSGSEYAEIAKLTVDPAPDTVIRIHMLWKALEAPVKVAPQVLPSYERSGFTLVEWGGTEIK